MKFLRDSVSSRFSLKLIAVILLSISLTTGCSNCSISKTDPPPWKVCEDTQTKPNAVKSEAPSTDHLVVYLDTSASMAGYVSPEGGTQFAVSPDGRTIFSKTLLELRNVVTLLAPQPAVYVRQVDVGVSEELMPDSKLSEAALTRNFFNGLQTDLAGAVKKFSEPLIKDEENKNPPRFHILVTDGVQSTKQTSVDTACDKGSDSFCVKKQLLELLNNGWSGTVLGLRGEFQGNVYSEISNRPVPFSSKKDAAQFRPFFLYIFSPDAAALEKLTVSLKQRLGAIVKSETDLREYALSSDYANGAATIEAQSADKDLLEVRKEQKDGSNPRLTVKVDLDTESKGEKQFPATVKIPWSHHAASGGSPDELLSLIKWELIPIGSEKEEPGLRYPTFKLVKQEIKNGSAELLFAAQWTKDSGAPAWRMYRLVGRLDADKPAPPWVRAWSTDVDTTAENGNRILYLESSFGNLWRNRALQNYPVADTCIRVGEK